MQLVYSHNYQLLSQTNYDINDTLHCIITCSQNAAVCSISGSLALLQWMTKWKPIQDQVKSGISSWTYLQGAAPNRPRVFLQRVYSLASAVDSDCSRTAPGHYYGSTQQLQRRHVSKRLYRLLTILGTLRVTASDSERVSSKLQRPLTSMAGWLAAFLLLQCNREHCPTPDDVLSAFVEKARWLNFIL